MQSLSSYFRNEILLLAVKRRFGEECEMIMKHLVKLSFTKSRPWEGLSSPVALMVLRDSISNDPDSRVPLQNLKLFIEQMGIQVLMNVIK